MHYCIITFPTLPFIVFFFSSRRRHTRYWRDWSSDVCSSDLTDIVARLEESQFAALAVDAIEPSAPVLCQRVEKRIAVLNRDMGPWGPLELRISEIGRASCRERV